MGGVEDYPFSFLNTVASLQRFATSAAALKLWQYKYSTSSGGGISLRLFFQQTFSCDCDDKLVIPPRFKGEIDRKIVKIRKELKKWIKYYWGDDFIDADCSKDFCEYFDHIVVNASGCIDYKATATNTLNSGYSKDHLLSYQIACELCLEDQIERIWPLVENDARIHKITDPNDVYDLVSYWTSRMKSSQGSSIPIRDDWLVEVVRRLPKTRSWSAFKYFWKMLPDERRTAEVISFLKIDHYDAARLSLYSLNRMHAEKVFQEATAEIVRLMSLNDKYCQRLCKLWTVMKNTILENQANFFAVLRELWIIGIGYCTRLISDYARFDRINDLVLLIWSSARDELKDYVSNTHMGYFFGRLLACLFNSSFCCYGHDTVFIADLLQRCRNLDKEQFWRKNWRELCVLVKSSCLERMMRSCLPNDDAVENFKSELADSKDLFESLIWEGFYSHLRDYLIMCSKTTNEFQRLAEKVLESNLRAILLHDDDKFAKFDWFVSELFSNVENDADEFKTRFISSAESLKCLLTARYNNEIRSGEFGRVISRFANTEQKLHLVKSNLLEHCRTYPIHCEWATLRNLRLYSVDRIHANHWQEFLEWCTVDNAGLATFKSSLNIDEIFRARLSQYFEEGVSDEDDILGILHTFLEWYFANEEDLKNFKIHKMINHEQIDGFRARLDCNDNTSADYILMNELLRWFF